MIYLDSSVLLELYLSQPRSSAAREIISAPEAKVSSWLLAVEVPVVLRRALSPKHPKLLNERLLLFDRDCRALHFYNGLEAVAARVRQDPRFARCRALDAIHVASALLLREELGRSIQIATFDESLRTTAEAFELGTL